MIIFINSFAIFLLLGVRRLLRTVVTLASPGAVGNEALPQFMGCKVLDRVGRIKNLLWEIHTSQMLQQWFSTGVILLGISDDVLKHFCCQN